MVIHVSTRGKTRSDRGWENFKGGERLVQIYRKEIRNPWQLPLTSIVVIGKVVEDCPALRNPAEFPLESMVRKRKITPLIESFTGAFAHGVIEFRISKSGENLLCDIFQQGMPVMGQMQLQRISREAFSMAPLGKEVFLRFGKDRKTGNYSQLFLLQDRHEIVATRTNQDVKPA